MPSKASLRSGDAFLRRLACSHRLLGRPWEKPVAVRAMPLMNQKLAAEKSKNHRRDESAASTAARAFAFLQALDVLHHTSRVDG
jgi:hypothetical protein